MRKILVVSSCGQSKRYSLDNCLTQEDFEDPVRLIKREKELSEWAVPAEQMYTGMSHQLTSESVDLLRRYVKLPVDWYIVSAGYGVIPENKTIVPYNTTFRNHTSTEILEWSKRLKIHSDLNNLVPKYDLVFFLLGGDYLKAIELPLESATPNQRIFIYSAVLDEKIQSLAPYCFVKSGWDEVVSWGGGMTKIRCWLFKRLAQEIVKNEDLVEQIYNNPEMIMKVIENHKRKPVPQQTTFF